jgi:hypothetical protein
LNEKFRVYIVLPLLPGFDNINAVQAVLYFIMRSITKGDASLFKRLERAGKSIEFNSIFRTFVFQVFHPVIISAFLVCVIMMSLWVN